MMHTKLSNDFKENFNQLEKYDSITIVASPRINEARVDFENNTLRVSIDSHTVFTLNIKDINFNIKHTKDA